MEKTFTPIQTSRLLLREFTDDDLELVFKGLSHPDVIRFYGVWYTTLEDTKKQMQFFDYLESSGTGRWWAVCSADNSVFYGGCGFNNLIKSKFQAELGFWLLPEFWGRGLMYEAGLAVCNYGFNEMGLDRIEALVESENDQSRRLLTKLDFSYEATRPKVEVKNGNFVDLMIFSKTGG